MASKAGSIVVDLLMRTGSFETDSKRAAARLKELQKVSRQVGTAIGVGMAAVGTAMVVMTARAIQAADKIDELSARFNVSAETLSSWGYVADRSGTSLDALAAAVPKLSKAMVEAVDSTSAAARLFRALGVDVLDPLTGKVRKVEQVLPELADVFATLEDDTTEAALAMQLFGKSGTELLEFLNRGSAGIAELQDRARALGVEIDGNTAAAAARFQDSLDDLKSIADGFGLQLAGQLAPALADTAEKLQELALRGDFASNVVAVLDAAMKVGVWTIGAYNEAVERTAYLFDLVARSSKGAIEAAKNVFSLGIADGSVAHGLSEMWNAPFDATDDLRRGVERRRNSGPQKPEVIFAGEGREPAGFFSKTETQLKLEKQRAALELRIKEMLAGATPTGGKGASTSSAQKTVQDMQRLEDAAARWEGRLLDMQAALAGPVAQANRDYQRQMEELEDAFQSGEVKLKDYAAMQDVLAEKRDRELAQIRDQKTPFEEMLEDLAFERELIGKTNEAREIAIAQRWAGVEAMSAEGKQLAELIAGNRQLEEGYRDSVAAMDGLRDAGKGFFMDVTTGAKSFKDAALDAFDSLHQRILSMIAENLMDRLFGKQGDVAGGASGAGGWLSTIGSWVGTMFGGSRAGGGDVLGGRGYWVGEDGPEWFQPRTTGTVVPNDRAMAAAGAGGGFKQTINIQAQGRIDNRTSRQMAADAAIAAQSLLARNGRGGR